jgi:hypothetical protein
MGDGNNMVARRQSLGAIRQLDPVQERRAQRYIASQSTSTADCAELLDMLGLLRHIEPPTSQAPRSTPVFRRHRSKRGAA